MVGRGGLVGNNRCGLVSRLRSRLIDWVVRSRGRLVDRLGAVGLILSLSLIPHISNEARISLYLVGDNLGTAIGKLNTVFTMGVVSVSVLLLLECLVVITLAIVVDIVVKCVDWCGIRVCLIGWLLVGWPVGVVCQDCGSKAQAEEKKLKILSRK